MKSQARSANSAGGSPSPCGSAMRADGKSVEPRIAKMPGSSSTSAFPSRRAENRTNSTRFACARASIEDVLIRSTLGRVGSGFGLHDVDEVPERDVRVVDVEAPGRPKRVAQDEAVGRRVLVVHLEPVRAGV